MAQKPIKSTRNERSGLTAPRKAKLGKAKQYVPPPVSAPAAFFFGTKVPPPRVPVVDLTLPLTCAITATATMRTKTTTVVMVMLARARLRLLMMMVQPVALQRKQKKRP